MDTRAANPGLRLWIMRVLLGTVVAAFLGGLLFVFPIIPEAEVPACHICVVPLCLVWFISYLRRRKNLGIASFGFALLVMVGMSLPFCGVDGVVRIKTAGTRVKLANDLRHIALALHAYHDKHGSFSPSAAPGPDGKPL